MEVVTPGVNAGPKPPELGDRKPKGMIRRLFYIVLILVGVLVVGIPVLFIILLTLQQNVFDPKYKKENPVKYLDIPFSIDAEKLVPHNSAELSKKLEISLSLEAPIDAKYLITCHLFEKLHGLEYRVVKASNIQREGLVLTAGRHTLQADFPVNYVSNERLTENGHDAFSSDATYSTDGPYMIECTLGNFQLQGYTFNHIPFGSYTTKPTKYMNYLYDKKHSELQPASPLPESALHGKGDLYPNIVLYETKPYKITDFK